MISHIWLSIISLWACKVDDPPHRGWAPSTPVKTQREQKRGRKQNLHLPLWARTRAFCLQAPVSSVADSLELRLSTLRAQAFRLHNSLPQVSILQELDEEFLESHNPRETTPYHQTAPLTMHSYFPQNLN